MTKKYQPSAKSLANLRPNLERRVTNPKGRPRTFKELRELAQQIANEDVKAGDEIITRVEAILRQLANDPKQREKFLEIGFGKVPNPVELTGANGGPVDMNWKNFIDSENADDPDTQTDSE